MNDTYRSQFTIGNADCLFSQHQAIMPRSVSQPRGQGKQRMQGHMSKSAVNFNRTQNLNVTNDITSASQNILTQHEVAVKKETIDQ